MSAPWELHRSLRWDAAPRKGGKGGGGGSSTTQVVYSPSEQAARDAIFAQGESLYNQMLGGAGTYRGAAPVQPDQATLQGQQTALGLGGQAAGTAAQALSSANFLMRDAANVNNNPYLQQAIQAAARGVERNYLENIIPGLRTGGMVTGSLGGSRQGVAEGIAARGVNDQIGDIASKMASAGYQTGLDQMGATTRGLSQIMQGVSGPASMISGVGAQRENIAGETEAYNAAAREQAINGPWQLLQARAGLMQGMSNAATQTNTRMPSQGLSPIQGIGGLLSLGSLIGKSDRRAKERIVYVGDFEGVPAYVFSYKGQSSRFIGAMADEVPAEARLEFGGIAFVDYSKLSIPFRQLEA